MDPFGGPQATRHSEVLALPASQQLARTGELAVYVAGAAQIPATLREIGRLRELTFRLAGEGTMQAFDLDRFDTHYQHLFVWHVARRQLVARSPRCRHLCGPVSISADYSTASRQIMVSYLQGQCPDSGPHFRVRPRHAFRSRLAGQVRPLADRLGGMDELCEVVSDIEPGGQSIPVLLRHYLNVGGRFLAFNVDR